MQIILICSSNTYLWGVWDGVDRGDRNLQNRNQEKYKRWIDRVWKRSGGGEDTETIEGRGKQIQRKNTDATSPKLGSLDLWPAFFTRNSILKRERKISFQKTLMIIPTKRCITFSCLWLGLGSSFIIRYSCLRGKGLWASFPKKINNGKRGI